MMIFNDIGWPAPYIPDGIADPDDIDDEEE